MGKFAGPSVLPGGQVELPTEAGTDSDFAEFFDGQAQDTTATDTTLEQPSVAQGTPEASQETVQDTYDLQTAALNQEQRARERIPAIAELIGGSLTEAAIKEDDPFSAALGRGDKVNSLLTQNTDSNHLKAQLPTAKRELLKQGYNEAAFTYATPEGEVKPAANPAIKGSQANIGASQVLYDPRVLDAGRFNEAGYLEVDPEFSKIMSLATENWLYTQAQGIGTQATPDQDFGIETEQDSAAPTLEVTKATGNQQLGKDIYQAWKRQKAFLEGKPTDEYIDESGQINPDTFTFIGDMAKEVYSEANPDILVRPEELVGDQAVFQLTPNGVAQLNTLEKSVKGLFGTQEVAPLNAVSETAQPVHEASTQVRQVTTKVGDLKDWSQVQESMKNYHSVTYVNDAKREAIAFQFGILGLLNHGQNNVYANMFDIGSDRANDIQGTKDKMIQEAKAEQDPVKQQALLQAANLYNPKDISARDRAKLLNIFDGLASYSGKINHLTFSMQGLTGRTHSQQTRYNPQAHKAVRFVVGGGNTFSWRPDQGGVIDRNFKEIMAALLLEDANGNALKDLTTTERLKAFDQQLASGQLDGLIKMGKEIGTAVAGFDAAGAKADINRAVAAKSPQETDAIKRDIKAKYGNDPLTTETQSYLAKHGDEGPVFAEALIDLARYAEAKKTGTPMKSSITVEMDGKTHGPATNAAQLGVEKMAERTGLLRSQDHTLTDDIDSRTAMGEYMVDMAPSYSGTLYPSEKHQAFNNIVNLAVGDRANFLKKSPMTMGYGQEIGSLKMHVQTTIFNGKNSQKIRDELKRNNITEDDAVTFLHSMLVDSIFNVMDPKVVAVSRLLRANNLISTMTNEVLYMDNAMGFRSYAGAKQTQKDATKSAAYSFSDKGGGRSAQFYRSEAEGSAVRQYEPGGPAVPGGFGHGRIIPIAVQSYDGNMISKTGSGKSWEKIDQTAKARGAKPFVLPIFDAFKTDLGSFDSVREESNNNWVDGLKNHSYVTAIMDGWYKETGKKFAQKMKNLDPNALVDIDPDSEWRGIHWLFQVDPNSDSGKLNLQSMIKKVMDVRPKKEGETIKDYQEFIGFHAGGVRNQIQKKMASKGIPTENITQLTNRQIQETVNIIARELQITNRNAKTVSEITRDKNKLLAKYAAQGREARQVDIA